MRVEQHQPSRTRVTPKAPRAPVAPLPAPRAAAAQPSAGAKADASLAPILARAVQERALRRWARPATATVQREVVREEDWWDTIGDLIGVTGHRIGDAVESAADKVGEVTAGAIHYVVGTPDATAKPSVSSKPVETTAKPKAEKQTARPVEPTSFPTWERGALAKPTTDEWWGPGEAAGVLDRIRGGNALMSRHGMPKGGDHGALKLVKQAILALGGEMHHLNLLPKAGATGPFGPETEAGVRAMQQLHGLSADGVVGARTMKVLDHFIGR